MPQKNLVGGTVYRNGAILGQVQRIIRNGSIIWSRPVTGAPRTASTATTRTVYSGHSLEDAAMYGNGWPGDMMRLRNALLDPDDDLMSPVYVVKDTIPGSPLSYRWDATDPNHEFAARLRPQDFESLVTTSAGPPMHDATPFFKTEFLDYLCRFAADRIERGAGTDIALWTIWPSIEGVNAPNPAGPEWAGHDTFETGLPEYGRIFEKAADYTTWKMHQLYTLPEGWRVWVYPGNLWWTQILADLGTSSVPGVSVIEDFFGDDIHPNNWGSWGLALFRYMCERQVDLRGNAVVAALAPADLPAGMHDYFCDIGWTIANSYPRAGLAGTVTDPQFDPATDADPMPLWTLAAPTTAEPAPPTVSTPASISPEGPLQGEAITLDFGAASGSGTVTGTYTLTEDGAVVRSGNVAGASTTYTVAAASGYIVLTVTWTNGYGTDPVSSDTVIIGVAGGETPDFLIWATADDYSALSGFTGTQPTVDGGGLHFSPDAGANDSLLRGPLPASTGAEGAYIVAAIRCDHGATQRVAELVALSTASSVWWQGSMLFMSSNGYIGWAWRTGVNGIEPIITAAHDSAQPGVYAVVESWTDTENVFMRVNGGPVASAPRGQAYVPMTHLHFVNGSDVNSEYYIAALGVHAGVPTEAAMTAARVWAQGLIP